MKHILTLLGLVLTMVLRGMTDADVEQTGPSSPFNIMNDNIGCIEPEYTEVKEILNDAKRYLPCHEARRQRKEGTTENAQTFDAEAPVAQQYDASSDALFGDRKPTFKILAEKPEHRIVCYLKAQGKSNNEIAKLTGITYPWVSQILRQPWARQRVLQLIKEAGGDEVTQLLQSTTVDSVYTLIEVRDNPMAKPAERTTAAVALLDRVLGKPLQRVETDNVTRNITTTVSELDQQLAGVDEELKRYGQN